MTWNLLLQCGLYLAVLLVLAVSSDPVLAYRDPTQKIVYDNYMVVRANLSFLKAWIDERIADLTNGKTANPEKVH